MSVSEPADSDLVRARLRAAVDAAQRALDEARALLGMSDAAQAPAIETASPAESGWVPDLGKLSEAEKLLKCSRATALRKIVLHGLEHVVDRRWQVDLARVHALLAKKPFPPLAGSD